MPSDDLERRVERYIRAYTEGSGVIGKLNIYERDIPGIAADIAAALREAAGQSRLRVNAGLAALERGD